MKAEDGITYERKAIEAWFSSCKAKKARVTSPWTREAIGTALVGDRDAAAGAARLRSYMFLTTQGMRRVDNAVHVYDVCKTIRLDPLRSLLRECVDECAQPASLAGEMCTYMHADNACMYAY